MDVVAKLEYCLRTPKYLVVFLQNFVCNKLHAKL